MNPFANKVAIITGGASGIGRAVGEELVRHGSAVVLADINGDGAVAAARAMGDRAASATVDVTDAGAVARLIDDVAARHGQLDYLFNNAGIAIMGDVKHMTLADWNRIVDINLRGVVNGVAAAYPLMIRQGFGHIINTASMAGLIPTPGATAYAATKHALVGLSTSLRGEAAGYGVKVSVVCPGFIDTPIKHATEFLNVDGETVLQDLPFRLHPVDLCARVILRGVARNRAIIVVTLPAHVFWRFYRFFPRLTLRLMQLVTERSPLLGRGGRT